MSNSAEEVDTLMSPVYILRSYAWEVLKLNAGDVWNEGKYGGMVPIVPVAEEPDLSQYDGPHIVYGYAINATDDLYARKTGSMTFAIYDNNFRRLTKTLNILEAAFERKDETATDVNNYSSTKAPWVGIRFGSIDIGFVEGGTPEDTEGGNQSALINIRFDAIVRYEGIVTDVRP